MRMFIGSQYSGKGYGKIIIKLFIEKYKQLLDKIIKTIKTPKTIKTKKIITVI